MNSHALPEMTRREFLKAAACTSSVLLPSNGTPAAASSGSKPNILYLMTDQHRGDCLGCADNAIIRTPNLDSLAADGVLFANAYSSTPSCTPARSAILTGLSPWHHDMLGDHHLWRKTYAHEGSAQIPMILRWPRSMGTAQQRGGRLPQPVELRDVLPTFLDAAGVTIPGHLDGRSLLELVRGRTANWRPFIDLEHSMCYSNDHWTALTDGRRKYIYYAYDGREQLFDLDRDPGECRDLAGEPSEQDALKLWRQHMVTHLSERGREFVENGTLAIRRKRLLYSPNFPRENTHNSET